MIIQTLKIHLNIQYISIHIYNMFDMIVMIAKGKMPSCTHYYLT